MMGESVISQTIRALGKAGVQDILVIQSPGDASLKEALVGAVSTGTRVSYHVQEHALGMGNAILSVKEYLKDRFLVVSPQQINIDEHLSLVSDMHAGHDKEPLLLFSQETDNPQKYGMLALDGQRVTRVVEKPDSLEGLSNQRILGIYILDLSFLEFMNRFETTEYQLEAALDQYAREEKIIAIPSDYPTLSLKYAWDLFAIAHHRFAKMDNQQCIHSTADIHPTAIITGPVCIEEGARIFEYAVIEGPVYIGKNAVVGSYCKVRKESILEEGVELQNNVEVKHSIIGGGTHIHSGFIGDSIIGEEGRIGAGFITANRRLDRKSVGVRIKGKWVDTKSSFFGSLIGDKVSIGIHCGTNPGTVVPSRSEIMPMTMISNATSVEEM